MLLLLSILVKHLTACRERGVSWSQSFFENLQVLV